MYRPSLISVILGQIPLQDEIFSIEPIASILKGFFRASRLRKGTCWLQGIHNYRPRLLYNFLISFFLSLNRECGAEISLVMSSIRIQIICFLRAMDGMGLTTMEGAISRSIVVRLAVMAASSYNPR